MNDIQCVTVRLTGIGSIQALEERKVDWWSMVTPLKHIHTSIQQTPISPFPP